VWRALWNGGSGARSDGETKPKPITCSGETTFFLFLRGALSPRGHSFGAHHGMAGLGVPRARDLRAAGWLLWVRVLELRSKVNEDNAKVEEAKAKVDEAEANENAKRVAADASEEAAEAGPSSTPPGPVCQP